MAKPTLHSATEKPLPDGRPDTSGTQMLMSNRRAASSAFQKAHRTEQAHLARKQAVAARTGLKEAKGHFEVAGKEILVGTRKFVGDFKAIPAVLQERRLETLKRRDNKNMEKALQKKKLWDERAAIAQAVQKEQPTS